jgi:diguanylate cyclase (GGDEF)-like protein/PAS domain S-box-containing protein
MKKKASKEKTDYLAVLNSLPEKENPFLEIIRLLTEGSDDIVYIHDEKGNYLYLSPGIMNVTGYTPEEWKADQPSKLTDHPINKLISEYTQTALQTGQKLPSYPIEILHKDGHPVLLEINETPFTRGGRIAGIIGLARDISERKKLLKFVEDFRSFLEANPIPLVIYDLEGLIRYLNPAFENTFGWDRNEVIGQKIPFIPPEEMEPSLNHIRKVLEGAVPPNFETRRLTKAGELLEINLTSFRYNDEEGNPAGIVAMLRDVTKRRALEREVQRRLSFEENLIESTMDGIIALDRQGLVILFNQGAAHISGYRPDEVVGKLNAGTIYPPGVDREIKKILWSPLYGGKGKIVEYETELVTKQGGRVPVRLSGSILFDGETEIGSVGYFHDWSERKQLEEALKRETVIREEIVEANPIPTIVLDRNHRVVFWNRACVELSGYTREEMVGSTDAWKPFYDEPRPILADLIINGDLTQLSRFYGEKNLRAAPLMKGAFEAEDFFENLKGEARYLYFLAAPIYDTNGELWGAIESIQDLTERKALEAKLLELATIDGLTGVYNRRFLERKLEEEAAKAKRYHDYLALILLDIDRFKEINDQHGHQVGDQVLKKTAEVILACMRTTDIVARYGGDEFVVLLPRTDPEQLALVVERLDYALENVSFWDQEKGTNRRFTVSYGAYSSNKDYDRILRQADLNMYQNKPGNHVD